jgi:glycosyltransferase involved in cell wall biosynthesis
MRHKERPMHILKRAAIRIDEYAKEAVRRWTYDSHYAGCDNAPTDEHERNLFARFSSASAFAHIKYLDNKYRKLFTRILHDRRRPLLIEQGFRKGAVLLAITSLGPGGAERQAVMTLLGLLKAGHSDLSLICAYLNGAHCDFYRHLLRGTSVEVAELRKSASYWKNRGSCNDSHSVVIRNLQDLLGTLPQELKYVEFFAREILERKPEIVHTWLDDVNVMAGIAAAIVGVPKIVISTRNVAPPNFLLIRPHMREAYRALASMRNVSFLNNSEVGAKDYERWLGLAPSTFKVIPNGFDFSCLQNGDLVTRARQFRERLGVSDRLPLIGSVLRFSEEKRPLLWVETAAKVSRLRPDATFVIVGDGPLRSYTQKFARKLGIGDRLFLLGLQKDPFTAMAAMDVFLLTSRMEGLPNVLIEAQALGVPVVTADAGGAVESLAHGRTGFSIKPQNADLLAEAIVSVLNDPEWRVKARAEAPKFISERFCSKRMVRDTLRAYQLQ